MSSQCGNSSLSAALVLAVVCGLVAFGAASAVLAAPPYKKDCTQCTDVYERLECRQEGIANQMTYISDTVFAEGTKLNQRAKKVQIDHIKHAKKKVIRAKQKHNKETFKKIAKAQSQRNKKPGHLVPFDDTDDVVDENGDPNPDGICDYEQGDKSARCAAIELTDSGELQVCNPEKKNKGKGKDGLECDLCFDSEEASTASEELDMEEAAEQMDDTYSAMEDDLIEVNKSLDYINENLPESSAVVPSAENGCDIPPLDPELAVKVEALRISFATVFGGARIAADIGGQMISIPFVGSINSRAIAIPADVLAMAVNIAYIVCDEGVKKASAEKQEAIANCVGQAVSDIADLKAQITTEHARIKNQMITDHHNIMTKLEEAVKLLNTAQGLRPEFPKN